MDGPVTNELKSDRLGANERIVDAILARYIHVGSIEVCYPSGQWRRYGDASQPVRIKVKRLPLHRLVNPTLFFGESYMSGNIQVAEDQLDRMFQLLNANQSDSPGTRLLERLPRRQTNNRRHQRMQISHHYDKGNDYYKLWLDKTLTYSCAYFRHPNDSLERAQLQKIDYLLRKLRLEPGQTLLDIGCGWGYLAATAAARYGVRVLGITLSHEQLRGATELAKRAGVDHLVDIKLANYQDLPDNEQFNRIISVGMFEHVGKNNHALYFDKIRKLLTDEGVSVLHTITARNDKPTDPWIDKYIFPGGHLPTVDVIEKLMADYQFCSIDRENLWQHYAMTLDIWRQRHRDHRPEIVTMFGETFYRMQDLWLAGSAATFRYAGTGLNQFIFSKNKPRFMTWPLTRDFMSN